MTGNDDLAAQVKRDYRKAPLDDMTRALMDYAVAVTRDARRMNQETIDRLRALGWSDDQILLATHIAGFFNYYTRLVDALGVEPEDFMGRPQGS